MRVYVEHEGYGCDTGCCGHVIKLEDDGGHIVHSQFAFSHPWYGAKDEWLTWAKELVADELGAEHVADLDWERCFVLDD